MKKVTVSAPGKLHLSGEHAVVYGKPAVLVATSKRLYVTLEYQKSIRQLTDKNQNDISEIKIKDDYLGKIIQQVEKKYGSEFKKCTLTIASEIPIGAGMGSSAALAVAAIGALREWLGKPWNPTEINELAFESEKIQHGNPSGGDNTVATFGGILWYRKELDFLKTFWLLPFKMPKNFASFVLINTGRKETTGDLVKMVGEKQEQNAKAFTLLISNIEEVTRQMAQMIHDKNEKGFRKMIKENERLLEEMGVVSMQTEKLVREIEAIDGVAKISGAGGVKTGSGIVIATHDKPQQLIDIAKKYGYPSFQVRLGGEGVGREEVIV